MPLRRSRSRRHVDVVGHIHREERETIDGVIAAEGQIRAWADEAEVGYDVEPLKKRGRGPPRCGSRPSQVVALRLTEEEPSIVDARAER